MISGVSELPKNDFWSQRTADTHQLQQHLARHTQPISKLSIPSYLTEKMSDARRL
jgi:hypothetical protein